jgi:hypothetical protein
MFMSTSFVVQQPERRNTVGYASGIALGGRRMRLSFVAGWRENPIPGALIQEVSGFVTPLGPKMS